MVNKYVILDRDGVLNYLVKHGDEYTAPWSVDEFKFIDGAKVAVDIIRKLGYNIAIVTNQPDVYDGKLEENDLYIINGMIRQWLGINTIICAYERGSKFYKPNNGMVEMLVNKYNIDRKNSFLIGDRWKDIVCGAKSNLKTIYIGKEYTTPNEHIDIKPDYIVENVLSAANLLMELDNDSL